MKTLQEALDGFRNNGGAGATLKKHLTAAGINGWEDMNRDGLYTLRDEVTGTVASNTARTIFLNLKALINRHKDQIPALPEDWGKILTAKPTKALKTYLTPEELKRFEKVGTHTPAEAVVKVECLLEAFTGARVSDVMTFSHENVDLENMELTYVSQKTKAQSTIPISKKVLQWIAYAQAHRQDEPAGRSGRSWIIRTLCERAGINTPVTVTIGNETRKGPKYQFVGSHTFRISFVTNLQQAGMELVSISRLAGHTNVEMTERYCAPAKPKLTALAQRFLGLEDDE